LDNGYPSQATEQQRLSFDQLAAVALHSRMRISPSEAARRGTWEFMTCVLLPDLVRWRFPGERGESSPDRYFAGRRNTFQRLWWRAYLLRDDSRQDNSYALLALLGEDEIVQILERPNLAAIRNLTLHVGAGLLAAVDRHARIPRRVLIREAQKHFMRLSSFLLFDSLSDDELTSCIAHVFDNVATIAGENAAQE
jgi:hypothetical protein